MPPVAERTRLTRRCNLRWLLGALALVLGFIELPTPAFAQG
jgi:hypothetical protein